jgi:hypothetical protein
MAANHDAAYWNKLQVWHGKYSVGRPEARFARLWPLRPIRIRPSTTTWGDHVKILHLLGVLFIIAWLVLWLAIKVTFAAVHALVVIGVLLILVGLFAGRGAKT